MAVVGTDMNLKFSVAAAAGNTTAGTGATSLGDQVSTTQLTSGAAADFFDNVSASEASTGDVEYRGGFVCNDHATDSATVVTLTVQSQVALGASFDIGWDPAGVTVKGLGSTQMATIANESTAPAGVTYSAGPLSTVTIPAGSVAGFWVRRTVTASTAAITTDGGVLRISGEG
jgi:hypothetical protein